MLSLRPLSVTSSTTHKQIGPFWCCFLSGWLCIHSRPLWISPMTSPVRLGVSPAAAPTPAGVFNQSFEALFPKLNPGLRGLLHFLAVPPGLSMSKCGAAGSASCSLACPGPQSTTLLGPPATTLLRVLSAPAACPSPSYPSG